MAIAAGKMTMNAIISWPGPIRSRETDFSLRPPRSGRRRGGACRTSSCVVCASISPRARWLRSRYLRRDIRNRDLLAGRIHRRRERRVERLQCLDLDVDALLVGDLVPALL